MADQEKPKTLSIKRGEKRDAHCKIYTEASIKEFIEKVSAETGGSFSETGRDYLMLGIQASGVCFEVIKS